jgi:methionyl-tRNA formyltransferase
MRTFYLGTSAFAAAVLERLARSTHRPELVVTRPDRPRGRGRRLGSPPVADEARRLGLELAQPTSVNAPDARELIVAARPEVVVICAFGALIKEPLLSDHEMLNVHPSLLPRWRGAAPMERAIEAGDTVTGISIMRPTAELDAGPVCLTREEPILPDDDFASLSERLAVLGGELLVEALDRRPPCAEQTGEGVTFAPKIEAADRRLDAREATAVELERRVRALRPHVGAWVVLPDGRGSEGARLAVHAARVLEDGEVDSSGGDSTLGAGELVAEGDRLLLGCASGVLELLEVQPAGGRRMPAPDWLRGHGRELARGQARAEGARQWRDHV